MKRSEMLKILKKYQTILTDIPNQREISMLVKRAESGDPEAENSLGLLYYDGIGVEMNYEKAFKLFSSAEKETYMLSFF